MATSKVLEQIGEWAICEDAQGLFYYNTSTQQSFDTPPPEVAQYLQAVPMPPQQTVPSVPQYSEPQVVQSAAQPPPPSQAKVMQQIGEWAICQDEQGLFYQNLRTNQSYDEAPVELMMQLQQSQPAQAAQAAPAAPAAPAQGNKAQILKQMGDWAICRDAQGQFYHNLRTNQSYDEAPPELIRMIQGQQAGPQPQAQPQMKQYQAQAPPQVQKYPTQQMAQKQYQAQQYQAQAQQYQVPSYQPPMVQQQAASYGPPSYQPPRTYDLQPPAQMYQQQLMQGQSYGAAAYQPMQQMQQGARPVAVGGQFRGF